MASSWKPSRPKDIWRARPPERSYISRWTSMVGVPRDKNCIGFSLDRTRLRRRSSSHARLLLYVLARITLCCGVKQNSALAGGTRQHNDYVVNCGWKLLWWRDIYCHSGLYNGAKARDRESMDRLQSGTGMNICGDVFHIRRQRWTRTFLDPLQPLQISAKFSTTQSIAK
jgi:hypothetical protein